MYKQTDICQKIQQRLEAACQDLAYEFSSCPSAADDKTRNMIRTAKRRGVSDIAGWLADEFYNDPDMVSDVVGDAVCEACHGDRNLERAVYVSLYSTGHAAMKAALKGELKKPKITAKQEGGDDGHCYVVRCNGVEVINGLTRRELPHYKKRAEEMYYDNPSKF